MWKRCDPGEMALYESLKIIIVIHSANEFVNWCEFHSFPVSFIAQYCITGNNYVNIF